MPIINRSVPVYLLVHERVRRRFIEKSFRACLSPRHGVDHGIRPEPHGMKYLYVDGTIGRGQWIRVSEHPPPHGLESPTSADALIDRHENTYLPIDGVKFETADVITYHTYVQYFIIR